MITALLAPEWEELLNWWVIEVGLIVNFKV
jgi:hypothetical protein